jgi:hypothetical protein
VRTTNSWLRALSKCAKTSTICSSLTRCFITDFVNHYKLEGRPIAGDQDRPAASFQAFYGLLRLSRLSWKLRWRSPA